MTVVRLRGLAVLGLLIAAAVGRSALGTRLDSPTIDEPWHVVAGVEYAREGDYRLNPEHPPLVKRWVGALMPASFGLKPFAPIDGKVNERSLVEETFYGNDFRAAQHRARLAMWAFHAILLLALGLLLWRAFGLPWAAGTLAFLAIDPTIGAHLPVVMTDLPLSVCLTIAGVCAGLLLATRSWSWTVALGVAAGLALGSKHSALPGLAGLAIACLVVAASQSARERSLRALGRRVLQLFCAASLGMVVLWGFYGFHFHARADGRDAFNRKMEDKVSDLALPAWRDGIAWADRLHLAPRSYLWGLADTVRAGVESRGETSQFLWGVRHRGAPPWYLWPSAVLIKVPLALLALSLLGAAALPRLPLPPAARLSLLALTAIAATHLLALARSQGAYAGVRHALPIVVFLSVVAGAAVSVAIVSRPFRLAVTVFLLAACGMTLREPRLWEYHNELVGGTGDAWRYFGNEGLDLDQRLYEIEGYHREVAGPSGEGWYTAYGIPKAARLALGLPDGRKVKDLDDANVAGVWEGYFVYPTSARLPFPDYDWDPAIGLAGLTPIARMGQAEIWYGRQVSPKIRADWIATRVSDYIYEEHGSDWELVARRLEEVLAVLPTYHGSAVELGNAYLRLGRRADAIRAYRQPLGDATGSLDAITRQALEAQAARLERGDPLEGMALVANRSME